MSEQPRPAPGERCRTCGQAIPHPKLMWCRVCVRNSLLLCRPEPLGRSHPYPEWPEIVHLSCELFGHQAYTEDTWARLLGWLRVKHEIADPRDISRANAVALLRAAVPPGVHTQPTPTDHVPAGRPSDERVGLLGIWPGGLTWRDELFRLPGKPLGVLRCLLRAKGNVVTAVGLLKEVWGDGTAENPSTAQNVKDAVKVLRQNLCKAMKIRRAKGTRLPKESDPVPCVGRDKDLAWQLNLALLRE